MPDPLVSGNPLLGLPSNLSPPPPPPSPATPPTGVVPFDTQSLLPWTEPVTYTSVRTAGNVADTVAAGCYRVGANEAARSNGVYVAGDVVFTVAAPLPGAIGPPKLRDTVAWAGETYTLVREVAGSSWLGFWKGVGRSARIAYHLRESLTVVRPAPEPGAGGLRAATGSLITVLGPVDGRLQLLDVRTEPDTAGRYATRTRYAAYLAGDFAVRAGDLIRDAAGGLYPVTGTGTGEEEDLGMLTTVECEVVS